MTSPLLELALLFGKLGATAFGGPAAHIAMMEAEVVSKRKWLSSEEFLDLVGAVNLIPGPNSTELAIHIGHLRAGALGLIVAGACFIAPAAALTALLAWIYVSYGALPKVAGVLYGVKPVIIAIILQALVGLFPKAVKSTWLGVLAAASAVAAFFGLHELLVIFAAGVIAMIARGVRPPSTVAGVVPIFLVFAKIGSVLFGSGYVLVAFLRTELVERLGWLTEAQLLDAVAAGQITPGPVFTTATFVGWILSGPLGAAAATAGIFLPAFIFVALSGPLVPRLRKSPAAGAFLDGVNVASLALMAVVTFEVTTAALVDIPTIVLAVLSAIILIRYKVNASWIVLAGAAFGLVATSLA